MKKINSYKISIDSFYGNRIMESINPKFNIHHTNIPSKKQFIYDYVIPYLKSLCISLYNITTARDLYE